MARPRWMPRGRRWLPLTVTGLLMTAGLAVAPASSAVADPGGPSAAQVQHSKQVVEQWRKQVADAQAKVAATQRQLDGLNTRAEVAIEAYDAAQVRVQRAQAKVQAAQMVLQAAGDRLGRAQQQMDRFAVAAYMSGGTQGVVTLVSAEDPTVFLAKASTLKVISHQQHDALGRLVGARTYQKVIEGQAADALRARRSAATEAARARDTAVAQVHQQEALLAQLRQEQSHLSDLLASAIHTAKQLSAARAAALERQRQALLRAQAEHRRREQAAQAAAARRAAQQAQQARQAAQAQQAAAAQQADQAQSTAQQVDSAPAPSAGPGGVVDAATEQRAVAVAMAQQGKPYVWGAAGPDTFDCSGLTMWSYAQVGVHIDHWTGFQWQEGEHVSRSEIRPGDLVFFATDTSNPDTIHHVGMYIGDGMMVNAPHTGDVVRTAYAFGPGFIGAVRPYAG